MDFESIKIAMQPQYEKLKATLSFENTKRGVWGYLMGAAWGLGGFVIAAVIIITVLTAFQTNTTGNASSAAQYGAIQLGSASGGLLSYLPIIVIAVVAGILFALFGGLLGGGKGKGKGVY